jgi:hypothetical protein
LERSDSAHKPPVAQDEWHSDEDDLSEEGMDLGTQEVPLTRTDTNASRTAQSTLLERLSPPPQNKRSRVSAGCDDDDDDDGDRLATQQDVAMPLPVARSPRSPSKKSPRHTAGLDDDNDDDERPATQQEVTQPSSSIAGTPQSPSKSKTAPTKGIELHNDKNDVDGPTIPQRTVGRALLNPSSLQIKTDEEARYFSTRDPNLALEVIDLISSDVDNGVD